MKRLILSALTGAAVGALGCGTSPGEPVTTSTTREAVPQLVAVNVEPVKENANPTTPVVAKQPAPAPQPPATPAEPFRFPNDAGGKKVAATLTSSQLPAPALPKVSGPRSRSSDFDRGEMPLPSVAPAVARPPLPTGKPPRPSPPPERVPADLGQGAAEDPTGLKLHERPALRSQSAPAPGAGDVPMLVRYLPDRASLDDPTVEIVSARTVFTVIPLPFAPDWFVRFGIPDPFEFANQIRGKTPLEGELATTPSNVPPARP